MMDDCVLSNDDPHGAVLRCSSRPGLRVHNYGACGIDCDECWNKAMKACVEKANAH